MRRRELEFGFAHYHIARNVTHIARNVTCFCTSKGDDSFVSPSVIIIRGVIDTVTCGTCSNEAIGVKGERYKLLDFTGGFLLLHGVSLALFCFYSLRMFHA